MTALSPLGKTRWRTIAAAATAARRARSYDDRDWFTLHGHEQGQQERRASARTVSLLATASNDKMVKIWDAATKQELLTLRGHHAGVFDVCFSPDSKRVATASWDQTAKIWSGHRKELSNLSGHAKGVEAVCFSPDGKRLATGAMDGVVKIVGSDPRAQVKTFQAHNHRIVGIACSPNGPWLATGSMDGTAKVWNTANGREPLLILEHEREVSSVCFSPNGRQLATATGFSNTAKILGFGKWAGSASFKGHTNYVIGACFSPHGERLATASSDLTAKVWDTASGNELLTLSGHTALVRGVCFSPDGKQLITACDDGTAKIWDVSSEVPAGAVVGNAVAPTPRREGPRTARQAGTARGEIGAFSRN